MRLLVLVLVLVLGCSSAEPARCGDPPRCPQAVDVALEQLEPYQGDLLLELGDTTGALALYQRYYDRVLSAHGDRDPALADAIDRLAAARRAQGKLRDALRLHDRALGSRPAASIPIDPRVAMSLVERAKTQLEAGELAAARTDTARAGGMIPSHGAPDARAAHTRMRLAIAAAAGDRDAAEVFADHARRTSLAPREALTLTRAPLLAARVAQLVADGRGADARALASAMRDRLVADRNPSIAADVGAALLAIGDRAGAAEILSKAAAALGNEPSRTALRVFTRLARASDPQAAAAARAAIALYQAMPALDRADHDEMWNITRR